MKENEEAKEKERLRRKKIIEKREEEAREKNERKLMKFEMKWMEIFIKEEKER